MKTNLIFLGLLLVLATLSNKAMSRELMLLDSFPTRGGIGLAFDPITDTLWTYGSDTIRSYDRAGTLLNTVSDAPGESANDADLDFADFEFTLGETTVPAGTLLFTNGETDTAEVYALDQEGTLLGTLEVGFGNSHIVGSSLSEKRGTFFMLQDWIPAAEVDNVVAELDAQTGAVLNQYDLDEVIDDFSVNFGDVEVSRETGNLLIVSNVESEILELTPSGAEVARWTRPSGMGGTLAASGIALDDARNELFVQTTGGFVYRFAFPTLASLWDCNNDGVVNVFDANCTSAETLSDFLLVNGLIRGDANGNRTVDFADFLTISRSFGMPGQYTDGDFDKNGTIEFPDFLILSGNFGLTTEMTAVPEPCTGVMLLTCTLMLTLRRKRT